MKEAPVGRACAPTQTSRYAPLRVPASPVDAAVAVPFTKCDRDVTDSVTINSHSTVGDRPRLRPSQSFPSHVLLLTDSAVLPTTSKMKAPPQTAKPSKMMPSCPPHMHLFARPDLLPQTTNLSACFPVPMCVRSGPSSPMIRIQKQCAPIPELQAHRCPVLSCTRTARPAVTPTHGWWNGMAGVRGMAHLFSSLVCMRIAETQKINLFLCSSGLSLISRLIKTSRLIRASRRLLGKKIFRQQIEI